MLQQIILKSNIISISSDHYHLQKTLYYGVVIDKQTKTIIKVKDIGYGIPTLKDGCKYYAIYKNKLYLSTDNTIIESKILLNFKQLYSKIKLRNWLYKYVIQQIMMKKYHPNYLLQHLTEDADLDVVLENWK